MTVDTTDPFLLAADILDPPGGGVETYYDDPVGFVTECIRWEPEEGPTDYQQQNLRDMVSYGRIAERGPHGLGKTSNNAWRVLWFSLTRDARGVDWKVITTASAWRQLEKYLWPEIRKWSSRVRWGRVGRAPFTNQEMMRLGLRLAHGEAFAVACEDPATIEGAHADSLLYIYDEAKTIPAETFDASEGAFMGAGTDTAQEALAVASSTPGPPEGRFYDIHARKAGLEDWHAVHVTLEDTIKAGRVSREKARQRARQWGSDSAVYINRVLGDFASSEEDGVIPLAWVELAVERGKALDRKDLGDLTSIGVDVAEAGGDKTVLALRFGETVSEIRRLQRGDVMMATGHIVKALTGHEHHPPAVVDAIGIGAGICPRLREQGFKAVAFKASEKSNLKDASGELGMLNVRAAAWWHMRDLLDPANHNEVALPDDDLLIGDLTAPRWKMHSSGKVQVEDKDEIRKRLGRSPDTGEAVIHAFWTSAVPAIHAPAFTTKGSRYAHGESPAALHGGRWV